jgi:cytochrome b subunit of formate dehydrogenase
MDTPRRYRRFSVFYRIEHWVLTISFALLAITGLVQRQVDSSLATSIVGLLGGIETVRLLHHIAAVVLMFETIYHIGHVAYRVFVLHKSMSMLPGLDDLRNALQTLRHNLGLSNERPQQGFYTFEEKLEYLAVVWGTVVMGVTGFMLWNPIGTTQLLPGALVPAAKMAHGLEALLAVVAIIIWHLYHVHLRHFNKSIFTGYLTEEEMRDEHPKTLAAIEAGEKSPEIAPEILARRRKIFFPVYGALAVVMLAGIYFFVGFEKTAIATLSPAEEVQVFVHLTPTPLPTVPPPPPTTAPVAPPEEVVTWDAGIAALMEAKCVSCHGSANRLGGLDLSTYAAAMEGGDSGPAIVPGEYQTSLLISRQASGSHPGQLTPEELELVRHWIEIGAPEK